MPSNGASSRRSSTRLWRTPCRKHDDPLEHLTPEWGAVAISWLAVVLIAGVLLATLAAGYWWWPPNPSPYIVESKPPWTLTSPWFEEIAAEAGVDFVHQVGTVRRFWFPEIVTGGAGTLDFDGDGWLDLYLVQGGDLDPATPDKPGNRLYRNLGPMRFEDVTESAGVGDTGYGMGCACGDYDADGHVDLYVTNVGPNVLYKNNGEGSFQVAAAGVDDPAWGSSAAFVDYDVDGDLDLYVVNYLRWSIALDVECFKLTGQRGYCGPQSYKAPSPDTLYRNDGNGSFTDVSDAAGIRQTFGNGLGIACADYNGDGWIDIYVANDGMPNQLWINGGDGKFRDEAYSLGCALNSEGKSEAGMGVHAADVDHDGDLDLYLSHVREETNTFYLNSGAWFDDMTARLGLARSSYGFTGFGLGFADFNHDRNLDIYVANGRIKQAGRPFDANDVYAEPNTLYVSFGTEGSFREALPRGGTAEELIHTSRGAVFADLDNDGDVDILVVNMHAQAYLLRNIAQKEGNWVMFRVLQKTGGYALHASVELDASGCIQRRNVQQDYSYCASNDPRVHFGLGAATTVDSLTVRWLDRSSEEFGPFDANQIYDVRQGSGRALDSGKR